ncbi:hypothetical protein AB0K02_29780 [Streptomyces sp. NPDC049597]
MPEPPEPADETSVPAPDRAPRHGPAVLPVLRLRAIRRPPHGLDEYL